MKRKDIWSLLFMFFVLTGCKHQVKNVDLAQQAMERARIAEADIYAPQQYREAQDFFRKMNQALDKGDKHIASQIAETVIDKANLATRVAHKNKATASIMRLKELLKLAEDLDIDETNPDIYHQANQALIDAESFYAKQDYEKAIEIAENGIKALNSILDSKDGLALATLNRAKELLSRAYKMTDVSRIQPCLTSISKNIDSAQDLYNKMQYGDSLVKSRKAIQSLEKLMSRYPSDGKISISVNSDDESLQLQAYELIHRLENTIKFIKKNNYVKDIYSENVEKFEQKSSDKEDEYASDFSMNMERFEDLESDEISLLPAVYMDIELKAQNMNAKKYARMDEREVISLSMIEDYHARAQKAYDSGNYLNAADLAREGLRLCDLYLSGQTLTNHKVIRGDTLWDISKQIYRTPWLWPNIWRANKLQIKDPDLIYPNQVFRIPPAPTSIQ